MNKISRQSLFERTRRNFRLTSIREIRRISTNYQRQLRSDIIVDMHMIEYGISAEKGGKRRGDCSK